MSSRVPQLPRHNALMCVTALELENFSTEQICHQTGQEWRVYSRKWKSSFNWAPAVCQAFSHVSSHSFKFWIVQKKNGLLAPLRVISFVTWNDSYLPKGVEATSQGAGKDRPRARSLPQPYALRTRGRNEKRLSPIHPTWMPNRLSGWRKTYLTWNSDSRI